MIKKLSVFIVVLLMSATWLVSKYMVQDQQDVFINEVRSWDVSENRSGYYGSDYIELYNSSKQDIVLDGWYISDDQTNLQKNRLDHLVLKAEGYLLLYAKGETAEGNILNFKLNPEGEKIFLSDSKGNVIDRVYVPAQGFGTAYARTTDGAKQWCVKEESTGKSNDDVDILPLKSLDGPVFSHESGFYEDAFVLTLKARPQQKIYYTLDGSEPTEESLLYTEGIIIENVSGEPNVENAVQNVVKDWKSYVPKSDPVDKAVVVRAIAADRKGNVSEPVTHTFFVDLEQYKEQKVISLVADFEDMFGDEGIFVTGAEYDQWYLSGSEGEEITPNFLQGGRSWEIQGNIQLFDNETEVVNQKAGIRTQGASNRLIAKKHMSIYAREEYGGSQYFENFKMGDHDVHSVSFNHFITNAVLPDLVRERNVAIQNAIRSTVFLNGEYWYECYTLEKYNKYYLEEAYRVNRDNVVIIKNNETTEGPEKSFALYEELLAYLENTDFTDAENYAHLNQMIDMQSYIDYICANVYLCNMDVSQVKNHVLWRTIENEGTQYGDTRWRWMIYDIDCLQWLDCLYYGVDESAAINSFDQAMQYTGYAMNEHAIFAAVKENPEFRRQFVTSFLDMANVDFSLENCEKVLSEWNRSPKKFMNGFLEKRFDYIVPYLAEEFELSGTLETVKLGINDIAGGEILLNTTKPVLSDGEWTGKYYTDYPITVTAVPKEGYRFAGWNGAFSSDQETIEAEVFPGGISLNAVFEKISE